MSTARLDPHHEASPSANGVSDWLEENQRALTLALAGIRARLEARVAEAHAKGHVERGSENAEPAALPPALRDLSRAFNLSEFESNLILMCAGVELDSAFAQLCGSAQGDPARAYATFSLALAALPGAHWSALTPSAPLRAWHLLEVGAGSQLTTSPLRISERVLHYLVGINEPDERLNSLLSDISGDLDLPPSQLAVAEQVSAILCARGGVMPTPVQLCGSDRFGSRAVAARACANIGLEIKAIAAGALSTNPADLERAAQLLRREAVLLPTAFFMDCTDIDFSEPARVAAVRHLLERLSARLILCSRERQRWSVEDLVTLELDRPSTEEQRRMWATTLGPFGSHMQGEIEQLSSHFDLGSHTIRAACARAMALNSVSSDSSSLHRTLWEACRDQARPQMDGLAQRIISSASWDDLVLPAAQKAILGDMAAHVRQRAKVYVTWGFGGRDNRGLGISALFSGVSGTGKTLAAEVLARELNLDLYRVDLSSVVSKFIGETEKNLRRVFDAGEEAGALLLFDEADALFGKRSEVKDSHDRYANIEVSYLLQRMECYRGLAILTTNLKNALDAAFLRRIRFIVQFPFPDMAQRAEIWSRVFPADTPRDGLDYTRLAQLNISGGHIRNIALGAAFLAADSGDPVRMAHLLRAAQSEYTKIEKTLTGTEIAGWENQDG